MPKVSVYRAHHESFPGVDRLSDLGVTGTHVKAKLLGERYRFMMQTSRTSGGFSGVSDCFMNGFETVKRDEERVASIWMIGK